MLSEIVRPLVRTQIRLLANASSTRQTLVQTIARWLGYLGVEAQVTQLQADADQIQVALRVGKPTNCDVKDWQKILTSLTQDSSAQPEIQSLTYQTLDTKQQIKIQRLLAYMFQVEQPDSKVDWERINPLVESLNLNEELAAGIRSALKVPQSLDVLLDGLEPTVAAITLEKAVEIALFDRTVNRKEDQALTAFLDAMKQSH
ncbi:MAG: hypothetical protein ACFBSC_17980 [Microcoleaceae cyanobacterium]